MDSRAIKARLKQIFAAHSHDEICEFVEAYAYDNQDLALALIDAFGTFDPEDAKALVEQCFMHPATSARLGTSLNWYAIGDNLGKVLEKAKGLRQHGDDLGAALIARYMLTMTWNEYMDDHPDLYLARGQHGDLHVHETIDMLRELLIDGDTIDFDSRKGLLKEIIEETKSIKKKDWLGRLDWFIEDAKSITMTHKGYVGFLTKKISSSYGAYKWNYIEKLVRYLLKHDEVDEARKVLQTYSDGGTATSVLVDYLTEHQRYDEAIEVIEGVTDTFTRYSQKFDTRLVSILEKQGDKDQLINYCRKRFLDAEYRWPYYEALKRTVPEDRWESFLQQLLAECDFHMDCDDTQVKLYKAEGLNHLFFPFFMKEGRIDIRRWKDYAGLMTVEEQRQVGEKLGEDIISMARRSKSRRDYEFVAEHVADFKKASPLAKKLGDKLIQDILDAVPGRPVLYDELMKV